MTDKDIIRQAFFALNGYKCPSLTQEQQEASLNRCYKILVEAAFPEDEEEESEGR